MICKKTLCWFGYNTIMANLALSSRSALCSPTNRKDHNFQQFLPSSGDLEVDGILYPRMQSLTVPQIFERFRFKHRLSRRGALASNH